MVRTIVSLASDEKTWLDDKARETGKSMTALVREAVSRYRAEDAKRARPLLKDLLGRTQGIWKQGDGLAWQKTLRKEWRGR